MARPTQCKCQCQSVVVELLQALTAQSNLLAEQNKLMAQIVDQNQMAMAQDEEDEPVKSRYLDG